MDSLLGTFSHLIC